MVGFWARRAQNHGFDTLKGVKTHKEQKARLIDYYALKGIKVMYIIEGNIDKKGKVSGIPYTTLVSSMINTMLREGLTPTIVGVKPSDFGA